MRNIKILSTACFKQIHAETAIPVFYLMIGWHEYVAISLNFVIFLKDNGRLRIWENFKRQIPANSLSFFVTVINFSSRSFPCNNFFKR